SAKPWSSGRGYWRELRDRIASGHMVPLEAVDLTTLESFDAAMIHGEQNLTNRSEFYTMLDVYDARQKRVTPLPL
ncbi:MAG TPA: hypothetical protein VLC09_11415, partial [Polyangiaceae bacterium]|nr:hypothetical protein [Polyangiaceae bacterium]